MVTPERKRMLTPLPLYILLFVLIGILMSSHLYTLNVGTAQCSNYNDILLERLRKVPIGSKEALELRKLIAEYLDGSLEECAAVEQVYQSAVDEYLAVMLGMLAGIGSLATLQQTSKRYQRTETKDDEV